MVSLYQVEEQLKSIGCNFRFWGRPEIKELPGILMSDEVINHIVNGRYEGGMALLCVTSHRLLLIDRKFLFTNIEDIRFDLISELNYTAQVFDGTIHISTPSRRLQFMSFNKLRLRNLLNYTQLRVMETRQRYIQSQFQQQQVQPQSNPQVVAGSVGNMALQGNNNMGMYTQPMPPANPYTQLPILLRRRHYPKF